MRAQTFSTVFTSHNCRDAEAVLKFLKHRGLHPADLGLTTPMPERGVESSFPVEVPAEEAAQARAILHPG